MRANWFFSRSRVEIPIEEDVASEFSVDEIYFNDIVMFHSMFLSVMRIRSELRWSVE